VSQDELQSIAASMGLGGGNVLGGFSSPAGSSAVPFGTIKWSSSGAAHPVSTRADAAAQAGFPVVLPAHLPAGVGAVRQFVVQPRVSATVTFKSTVARVGGSSVTLAAGPAVLVQYGATGGTPAPTLAIATMPRPTARSTGASMSQIEAFLLSRRGVPPALAEEVRLLGDLRTTLPVPVPPGVSVHSVQIGGWPGVLLSDGSNAVAGVVWEDGQGMLHGVAGILDSKDVLNVADQLG
jgi:hypothetical protein